VDKKDVMRECGESGWEEEDAMRWRWCRLSLRDCEEVVRYSGELAIQVLPEAWWNRGHLIVQAR